ncbi:helix-turn-helix domain-containing protein [Pedobacter aquatilis]|uniref:helix-turn-helix domain-containing protein n=1 Tax=Pedobacter aquatilis TaxID=351343 RepID=UPI002930DE57|nr:helix-turn-helix domain-containing protein [Pedobacter aquatilis]
MITNTTGISVHKFSSLSEKLKVRGFYCDVMLLIVERGTAVVTLEDSLFKCNSSIILIDAFQTFSVMGDIKGWCIRFPLKLLEDFKLLHPELSASGILQFKDLPFCEISSCLLSKIRQLKFYVMDDKNMVEEFAISNTITFLLLHGCSDAGFSKDESYSKKAKATTKQFKIVVARDGKYPRSLNSYCAELKIKLKYLNYACRLVANKNARHFMQDIQMEHIDSLILNPKLSIYEVMRECGFSQTQAFSTHFKRLKGCTPAAFRKSVGLEPFRGRRRFI